MTILNLTPQDREELYRVYTTTLNSDIQIRCLMILLYHGGYSISEIEKITYFDSNIVTECFRRYSERRINGIQELARRTDETSYSNNELADAHTYQHQVLRDASIQRLQDSKILLDGRRYRGSIYLGSYAIECILKCYLCQREGKTNFLDTKVAEKFRGVRGHNIQALFDEISFTAARARKTSDNFARAFQIVYSITSHTSYRYNRDNGSAEDAQRIIPAIQEIHTHFLRELQ